MSEWLHFRTHLPLGADPSMLRYVTAVAGLHVTNQLSLSIDPLATAQVSRLLTGSNCLILHISK